jgi:hypothetical protein
MSWDDDSYADEYGEHRAARTPTTRWKTALRVVGFSGAVAGVLGLVVGAVIAVNLVGLATTPGGFAAPAAHGAKVALPPVITPTEQGGAADRGLDPSEDPGALPGAGGGGVGGGTGAGTGTEAIPMPLVDPDWVARIAAVTGIPERALSAYALAHVSITEGDPECGLDWTTIAAIGAIESGHGSHAGTVLDENGNAQPAIIGRALDGDGVATIEDTDGGVFDGDATWDRAVGPMQFIPSTWAKWGSDANGDGVADPNQIDDAARSAAEYLCASGPMTSPEGWRAAIFSYNHDNSYVDKVATVASDYLASAG